MDSDPGAFDPNAFAGGEWSSPIGSADADG
jgi:hypothetical protein